MPRPTSPLARFGEPTRAWFEAAFPEPTAAQAGAWEAIGSGRHALVVAPTGSGKTLAAFLSALDRLATEETPEDRLRRTRVLYVSPLKALAVDVERNLRTPLVGIRSTAERLGQEVGEVTVGVRSGDTSAADRRRLGTRPPDILITTPESLFLMLTSQARETLRNVSTVIVDEVHAVASTKRGAHLALTLERLDALLERPAQRVGLSATVRPVEEVARFLGGSNPVEVVSPGSPKEWDLEVVVPVEDMTAPGEYDEDDPSSGRAASSIWPHVENHVLDLVLEHRSTIVFANSRRVAERLTGRLNELAAERLEEGEAGAPEAGGAPAYPAQVGGGSGTSAGAAPTVARAHHGSVSREQRELIEDDLKTGRLPCVVATSSLELGIDMGAVDLVVQIGSPPSVASALQRVGRAGHQVGETSHGVLFPQFRADLAPTAVAVESMRTGAIESMRVPMNPLDVLAQQVVAAVALEPTTVDELFTMVRRAAPYAALPRSAFDATLDLLAGRYPSDEFAELRPRVVWDRVSGTLTARPGAQRLAVTSGGTIPDRGLFGVFLVGAEAGSPGRRVGELDEEMVYESRVGDVFALGATSWRIEDITHDRVLVTPAPGVPGRLPFWRGDAPGRPTELGAAVGALHGELGAVAPAKATALAQRRGLDAFAAGNLVAYVGEQREATGSLPTDRTLVLERFRDELGDWRLVLHSPYGVPVHAPWALAINARLRERFGVDGQAHAADDGIVVRLPDTGEDPPGADVVVFDPDELEQLVTAEVGSSSLFASRFRECAARALLLPRRDPGRRAPLWQQRQRAAQLLEVASKYPSFPIVLEAVRECLQDVYDLPGLLELHRRIGTREVQVSDVETPAPSPFARSLLFGYVAQFVYEGDSPLAERRAAALALDPALLAELLGRAELRELLDPDVVQEVEAELQRLPEERRARDAEALVDVVRVIGPLTTDEAAARSKEPDAVSAWLDGLAEARRVVQVRVAGEERWAVVEDVARLRDALGVAVPPGVPQVFTEPVEDPLGDLVARYARTHGPFTTGEVAGRLGLGGAVVASVLSRLAGDGRVVEGEFRPGGSGSEWCDAEVLRRLRSRSLARLRQEVEPVDPAALARFLPAWQSVRAADVPPPEDRSGRPERWSEAPARSRRQGGLRGVDGVLSVVEQLAGCPVPASAWESLVLPGRVRDYTPGLLDELTASGEVVWSGQGTLPGTDGWVALHPADTVDLTLAPAAPYDGSELHDRILEVLAPGGALFFRQLVDLTGTGPSRETALTDVLWDLVWSGRVTNDTLAPLRGRVGGSGAHRTRRATPRSRPGGGRGVGIGSLSARPSGGLRARPTTSASTSGRWALLPVPDDDPTRRGHAGAELLLGRHGVVTRGAVVAEGAPGGFAAAYKVLAAFEDTGRVRRGYFVAGLGAAQFGTAGAVDRLRTFSDAADDGDDLPSTYVLAATDPANPYGAALPWPDPPADREAPADGAGRHRPGRKSGAVVVLDDGALALYLERGGRTLLTFTDDPEALRRAAVALAGPVVAGGLGQLTLHQADGVPLLGSPDSPLRQALGAAGFVTTPKGLRLRARG
ncbi:ATP-dependent helicase [Nocardioides zeae]|uniref:ATP-dependent helicase n=1 Tax=Nocardioides imazamoxiresistens TaxID=3231893 RepID=A0ABU3PUK1_9ACTN|nr:ATP-dependent helicase [Nocardioides zeae]MDT9592581.1 ATP-dependent helicase [Nocardioides zeae]